MPQNLPRKSKEAVGDGKQGGPRPTVETKLETLRGVDEEFDILDYISLKWQRPVPVQVWNFLFGATALLDFSAAVVTRRQSFWSANDHIEELTSTSIPWHDAVILWLRQNSTNLSILFSLLWTVDAFVEAHRRRLKAVSERDRQRLLEKDLRDNDDNHSGEEMENNWWKGYLGVYYRTIIFQFLLLPVGFYVQLYNQIRKLQDPSVDSDEALIVHEIEVDQLPEEIEVFSPHSSLSLGLALAKHLIITVARLTGHQVRFHAVTNARKLAFRVLRRAIRHPVRFYRKVHKMLRVVRWLKYLAPLFGAFNKLLGNVKDLFIKYQQKRDAQIARRVRLKLRHELSEQELREYCAILIQKTFRAHQARKYISVIRLMLGQQKEIAARKISEALRACLRRARLRLKTKLQKLQELKEHGGGDLKVAPKKDMSERERRKMYLLQEQLENEARYLLNEKLLLRPNTTFAVTWKILFVVAILFEIAVLACQPILARHIDPMTGKSLDIETVINKQFLPIPVSKLPECIRVKPFQISIKKPVRSAKKIFDILLKREVAKPTTPKPFYCGETFKALQVRVRSTAEVSISYSNSELWATIFSLRLIQSVYIIVLKIFIQDFLALISVVCFADVFVVFFTGTFNPETGKLEPRKFFQRWILPGLVLQLLVNPKMEYVSDLVGQGLSELLHHGPIRILRWTTALFYPVLLWVVLTARKMWFKYAADQNRSHALNNAPFWPSDALSLR